MGSETINPEEDDKFLWEIELMNYRNNLYYYQLKSKLKKIKSINLILDFIEQERKKIRDTLKDLDGNIITSKMESKKQNHQQI